MDIQEHWLFQSDEFLTWLSDRSPGRQTRVECDRCQSCGEQMDSVGHAIGGTCGYCLAYEFGAHCESKRFATALSGLVRTAVSDPDAMQRLSLQLLEETTFALAREGALTEVG